MPKKVLGTPGAIEQPKKYSGGPTKPDVTVRAWKGPKAAILAMIEQVKTAGWEWSIEESGPNATLTAQTTTLAGDDPGGDVLVDTWELTPGEVEKDLLEADIQVINNLPDATKQKIRKIINTQDESTIAEASFGTAGVEPAVTAFKVYKYMAKGMRAIRVFAPVLKHTQTVSSTYATPASLNNVGRILKSTTLVQTAGNGESVPGNFLIAFNGPPFNKVAVDSNFAYGWFKKPPTLSVSAGSRLQISQEFEFGLWPVLFYLAAL